MEVGRWDKGKEMEEWGEERDIGRQDGGREEER